MPNCNVCGESFLQTIKLKLHMRTHEKESTAYVGGPAVKLPPNIDKLNTNPVVRLTDASAKTSPKQFSAQGWKEQSLVKDVSNPQTGHQSTTKTENTVPFKSNAVIKTGVKTSIGRVDVTPDPDSVAAETAAHHNQDIPQKTKANVTTAAGRNESASDAEKKKPTENGEKTPVPAAKRSQDRPRPGPLSSKKPRLTSPAKLENMSPIKSPAPTVKASTQQDTVKDEDTEMKGVELAACPVGGCTVKCHPTKFYTHMAIAHGQHICEKCGEANDSAADLEVHMRSKTCKKKKSKKAPKSSASETTVEIAKKAVAPESKEPKATQEKNVSSSLELDSDADADDKILASFFDGNRCKGCNKVFRTVSKKLMIAHYENDCSGNPKFTIISHKCETCEQLFDRKAILDNHVRTAHGSKITCDCDEVFDTKEEYKHHWNTTHGRKKRKSPRGINQAKRGRSSSPRVRRTSYKEESDSSGSSYRPSPGSVEGAKKEMINQGGESGPIAEPAEIQKNKGQSTNKTVTSTTADTTTGNEIPSPAAGNQRTNPYGPRTHTCKECETVFFDKMDLAMHLLEHNKEREFPRAVRKVGTTNAAFFLPKDVLQKCCVCGGGFNNTVELIAHITKTHDKPGTFPCVVCQQVFTDALELFKHTAFKHPTYPASQVPTSTPAPPFINNSAQKSDAGLECCVCHEKMKSLTDLNEHMVTDHPDKSWFVCSAPGCESPYSSEKSLNRHLQKDHNIQPIRRM